MPSESVQPAVRPAARPVVVRPTSVHRSDTRRGRSTDLEPFPALPAGWTTPPAPVGLARASIALALVWGVVQLLLLASAPGEVAQRAAGTTAAAPTAYAWLSLGLLVVQSAALVVVGTWVRRSQVFATHLAPGNGPRRGDAWPWFAWVLPVVSFWFPCQMVRDLRRATMGERLAAHRAGSLGAWWGWWVALSLATNSVALRALDLRPEEPVVLVPYETVVTVLTWVPLVLWVGIVREVTRVQRERAVVPTGGVRRSAVSRPGRRGPGAADVACGA
ncbi:hypothetical protein GCM10009809_24840 [Isoptericola hypogeus]|uniref:DUF4328 domain-containing protein n=1 Tax=Isoptericola hypogeus TaxID=300179 RepID=A0ABN2JI98_9MICO